MTFVKSPLNRLLSYRHLFGHINTYSFSNLNKLDTHSVKLAQLLQKNNHVRLWSLEQLLPQTIPSQDNRKSSSAIKDSEEQVNIVVNKYFSTVQQYTTVSKKQDKISKTEINGKESYTNLIEDLNGSKNWVFLPNFYNIIRRHQHYNSQGLHLLIGDLNEYFLQFYLNKPFITLQQLCAMYPEKVPLSYRSRLNVQKIRTAIEARLTKRNCPLKLNEEPRFSQIIMINDKIKMWDQAYQIMLDQLPIKITVPFHCTENSQKFYKLSLKDFVQGFKTSHKIIHPNIPLQIDHQNCEQFVEQVINRLSKKPNHKFKSAYQIEVMDKQMNPNNKQQQQLFSECNLKFQIVTGKQTLKKE